MSTVVVDYAAIWNYDGEPKEIVAACNLCGHPASVSKDATRNMQNRYGYQAVSLGHCSECGLWFLNPRMTREAYARFYETAYRPLVSAFHGREINAQTIVPEQKEYARRLVGLLRPWIPHGGGVLLDVGGSTGVVAQTLAYAFKMDCEVLDPSEAELWEASDRITPIAYTTIPVHHGFFEDFDAKGRTWDLITLCQTADHLLDLMGALKKIRGLLSPDGLFWADIVDFDKTREVKIDHPFNLTEKTFREFLKRAGFVLLQVNYAPAGVHIGFLCKAAA